MPRTSYALKAAGLSIAVMLVAAPPATSGAGRTLATSANRALFATGPHHDPALGSVRDRLWLLDGSLRPRGWTLLPSNSGEPRLVVSPDRTRVALFASEFGATRVRILRLPDLATVRDRAFEGVYVGSVVWPRRSTIVVVESPVAAPAWRASLVALDAATLRRRSRRSVRGAVAALGVAGGRVFAVTDDVAGGVRVLRERRAARWAERRLPLARVLEPWRATVRAPLPPRARQAVAAARVAAAAHAAVEIGDVRVRAVAIGGHNSCEGTEDPFADMLSGYRVYVDAGAEHLVYAYGLDAIYARGRLVRCWSGSPRREPVSHAPEASRNLLTVPGGTWEATALSVATDPLRRRLLIASGGGPTFEVDLRSLRYVRRPGAAPPAAWVRSAFPYPGAAVSARAAAFTTGPRTLVVDRVSSRPRALVRGTTVAAAGGRLLVEAADLATYVGLDASGRRRYRVRVPVGAGHGDWRPPIACGTRVYVPRSVYVRRSGLVAEVVSVLDVARGRRLARRTLPAGARLLPTCS